jgi:hypothetical protein
LREDAGGDQQTPAALPADLHPFKPDGNGTCESCGLPEVNRHHLESA